MTEQQQMDWIDSQQARDPMWAAQEKDIRSEAARLYKEIMDNQLTGRLTLTVNRPLAYVQGSLMPIGSFESVIVDTDMVAKIGGLEGVLLLEEILRRAKFGEDYAERWS